MSKESKRMTDAELAEAVARLFHDTYEQFSYFYGYTTREDTRVFDPASPNGRTMIATIRTIMPRAVLKAALMAERGKE